MRHVVPVILLTGCDLVFKLQDGPPPDANPVPLLCPPRFDLERAGSRYQIVIGSPTSWTDAEQLCEVDAPSIAHLAVPNTREELDFLKSQLSSDNTWVGIARFTGAPGQDKASFLKVTGGPAPDLWRAGEPSNSNGMEYAVAISDGLDFTDFDPKMAQARVCECDMLPPIELDF